MKKPGQRHSRRLLLSSLDLEQINTRWDFTYLFFERRKIDNTFFLYLFSYEHFC